jgi:hypothetical protein
METTVEHGIYDEGIPSRVMKSFKDISKDIRSLETTYCGTSSPEDCH